VNNKALFLVAPISGCADFPSSHLVRAQNKEPRRVRRRGKSEGELPRRLLDGSKHHANPLAITERNAGAFQPNALLDSCVAYLVQDRESHTLPATREDAIVLEWLSARNLSTNAGIGLGC
jgi:hypothetical protein